MSDSVQQAKVWVGLGRHNRFLEVNHGSGTEIRSVYAIGGLYG
jgi:hypothetical protein